MCEVDDGVDVRAWRAEVDWVEALVGGRFGWAEPRRWAGAYLRGLLAPLERKNGWTLAEYAGAVSPDGMQRLVRAVRWDADEVRDDLHGYVVAELGDPGGILAVDEIGFVKKGVKSAGVARQYTGTTGKVDNCQVGVFLSYLTPAGDRTLIDRELYLPKAWTDDRPRCQAAGIGDEVGFATKPELARRMIERVVAAKVPFAWVTTDEAYGQHRALRRWLHDNRLPYVMATRRDEALALGGAGRRQSCILAGQLTASCWERRSAGDGAHGPRLDDWAWVALAAPATPGWSAWLLIRRSIDDGELAFYVCAGPAATTLPALMPRRRPPMGHQGVFPGQQERDRLGPVPGPHLPRLVPPRHPGDARAHPARRAARPSKQPHQPAGPHVDGDDLIPLTVNEIRRLIAAAILLRTHEPTQATRWSRWRRRRQAQARRCHYRRRGNPLPRR